MEEKKSPVKVEKKVEQLIFRDDLTGAFNRRYLYQYLPQELVRCKNTSQNLWLFMIDVDNFKQVNDRYGHLKGDEALEGVAETLKESVRSADTVVRYAGDEFTVVVSSAEATVVNTVAARIMSKISSRIFKAEGGLPDFHINLSIGIANFPDDAIDTLRLIDLADKALYASKQKGKNCVSYIGDLSADIFVSRAIFEIFPCSKLIEREKQINDFADIFEKVNNDKISQMVLISGAAGTGKSRLAQEFLKIAKSKGFVSFLDACSEKHALIPFRSAFSTLEKYLKKNQIKKEVLLEGVSTEEQIALGQALPILKKLFTLETMDEAYLKESLDSLILQGLRKIYINISRQSKICIVIDDFYWADLGSLNLIGALKDQKAQLLICFLLREEELLNRSFDAMPLIQFKDSLDRFFSGRISVENISFDGLTEMLSTIFSNLLIGEEFTSLIHKITKGNPLFIEELLKFMVQKGFLFCQKGRWLKIEIQESDLPHSLEDVILERIKGLEKPAQEIIVKAAVIGQDFSTELLQRMGREGEGYILDVLESAKRVGLIKEKVDPDEDTPSGEGMSFVNEEVRKVVSDLAGEEEVKKLHRQLGEIEESLNVDNLESVAEELLYRFKKAEDLERSRR
ncbi:MAG: diguanylate cyclase, partial [Candidatus Omnitrophota bacterium]|nr:diguanylate cyclase [Candidatus Omnitrophota bacterium]